MFTLGSRRMIIRGDSAGIKIGDTLLNKIQMQGWRWSAHVHPGVKDIVLNASGFPGDRAVLEVLGQSRSLILNSTGRRNVFDITHDMRITPKIEYSNIEPVNRFRW